MINPLKLFTKSEYIVAYRLHPHDLLEDADTPFTVFPRQKSYWLADPFAFCYNSAYYVFTEVFQNSRGYASIGCSKIENGVMTEPQIVLDVGSHMSFPLVFVHNEKIYMAPENCVSSRIRLFECKRFPDQWEEIPSDVEGIYCDTTIWKNKAGELLAFSSLPGSGLYGCKLYLLKLKIEDGRLHVTDQKLITDDARFARQGGQMLQKDGVLYRVAQDCSGLDYGKALHILRVTDDSFDGYAETFYRTYAVRNMHVRGKTAWRQGTHTYNRSGELDVIDFKIGVFSPQIVWQKIRFALSLLRNRHTASET